jgi:hypothetical protein
VLEVLLDYGMIAQAAIPAVQPLLQHPAESIRQLAHQVLHSVSGSPDLS